MRLLPFLLRNRYALAFTLGSLLTLGLPPVGFFPVIFLVFPVQMWLTAQAKNAWGAFLTGWAFGSGYFIIGFYWFSIGFTEMYNHGTKWPLAAAAFGPTIYVGLYFAAASALAFFFRRHATLYTLAYALCFFWAEYALGHEPARLPWNLIGAVWYHALPVLQSLSVIGIYGLTFLTLLWAALPYLVFRDRHRPALLIACTFLIVAAGGLARLLQASVSFHPDLSVQILQANITREERRTDDLADKGGTLARHLALMKQNPAPKSGAFLSIWPEGVLDVRGAAPDRRYKEIAAHLPRGGYALIGAHRLMPHKDQADDIYNSLIVLDKKASVRAIYDKTWLVPWGEYVPFDDLLKKTPLGPAVAGFTRLARGQGPQTIDVDALPAFSPMICYEASFTGAITPKDRRPDFLLSVSNDAWTEGSVGPLQNYSFMRLRAIEEGLPVLRAANIGISAVIDPYGRELQKLSLHKVGVIDARMPQALAPTVFALYGDRPLLLFMMFLTGIVVALPLRKRRN